MAYANEPTEPRTWINVTDRSGREDNTSCYRPPGHNEKANLPMFMQITEAVKEAMTLITWDLNSHAMD